jgi:hypothetical protein
LKLNGLQNKSKWEWNRNDFHFLWVEQSELTGPIPLTNGPISLAKRVGS